MSDKQKYTCVIDSNYDDVIEMKEEIISIQNQSVSESVNDLSADCVKQPINANSSRLIDDSFGSVLSGTVNLSVSLSEIEINASRNESYINKENNSLGP